MSLTKYNVSFDAKPQQQELFLLFSFRKHVRFFILLRQQQKDRGNGYLFPPQAAIEFALSQSMEPKLSEF
jgi:hypothetical protein